MKGVNQFSANRLFEKRAFANAGECVFVSYSRLDKEDAIKVVNLIEDLGIDVYFDQYDEDLQLADEEMNHEKVVECIEKGLDHAVTLLGIITENTKKSWWVPYEIGSANGRSKAHAHLITSEVKLLPSYIQASTILPDLATLDEWLVKHVKSRLGKEAVVTESLLRMIGRNNKSASMAPVYIHRSKSDLTFY